MKAAPHTLAPVEPAGLKRRVLVVEDHPLMRRSIVEALEREPDLAVCGQADDTRTALAAIASLQPDLVLTDIQLKSSSGLDLIKTLRARTPELPVVAATMFNVNQTERLARAAGAAGFVSKQLGPEKLVATIRAALKQATDNRENPRT